MPSSLDKIRNRRAVLVGLFGLGLAFAGPALAGHRGRHGRDDDDEDDDHDRAHDALERGEVRPLAEILGRIRPSLPAGGEIVDIDFDRRDERWFYRFKVIDRAGTRLELLVDAATGEIVETREH
ncbi:MAG TPA: peptidase [Kaistiaceae bacterium]|nr:peptidase [Kaistiaceae bacterium]